MEPIKEMSDKIDALTQDIREIRNAIIGNPLTNDGGIIERIRKLEQKIDFWDKVKIGAIFFITTISAVIGWIFSHLKEIINLLFHY